MLLVADNEKRIVGILDDNPSFCMYPERLYVMLALPMKFMSEEIQDEHNSTSSFQPLALKMIRFWAELNDKNCSLDHFAHVLAKNGHFCTAGKFKV